MKQKVMGCAVMTLVLTLSRVALANVEANYWLPAGGGILGNGANWSLGAPVNDQVLAFTNNASCAVTELFN